MRDATHHLKGGEENKSYCGEDLNNEFFFKDVEQVLINNEHGERLLCTDCLYKLRGDLLKVPPMLLDEKTND